MMVKVGHSGVQAQEFLTAFPPSTSLLPSWAERTRLATPARFALVAAWTDVPAG